MDRFGRVVEQKWQDTQGTPVVKDQFKYGYDRASNRLWRQVGPDMSSPPSGKDEFYGYDGLDRLLTAHRGTLDGTPFSGVSNPTFKQEWKDAQGDSGLEGLGNWRVFRQATDGSSFTGSADLTQTRTHNEVNEITGFAALADPPDPAQAAWVNPTYDAAGNMSSAPKPGPLAAGASGGIRGGGGATARAGVWRGRCTGGAGGGRIVGAMQRGRRFIVLLPPLLWCGGCYLAEPFGPNPEVPPSRLERVSLAQALSGPRQFTGGAEVWARRDERGGVSAMLGGVGQVQRVPLLGQADFYALSDRPDVIIVHDRFSLWEDTIRVYNFSPSGARVRSFGHGTRGAGYNCRLYRDFRLIGGRVEVREEFSTSGRPDLPAVSRTFFVPCD